MENQEAPGLAARAGARSVVITGASSGIGRASALLMAREGFEVFAAVRQETDARKLVDEGGSQISPVMIDVTDDASIQGAAREVGARLGDRAPLQRSGFWVCLR